MSVIILTIVTVETLVTVVTVLIVFTEVAFMTKQNKNPLKNHVCLSDHLVFRGPT